MKKYIKFFCVLMICITGCQLQPKWEELGPSIKSFKESVVAIVITKQVKNEERMYVGSGFVIGNGYIITNSHVMDEGADKISILWDNTIANPPLEAKVVYNDRRIDLALLYIDDPRIYWEPLSLDDEISIQTGDPVLILGFPDISQPESGDYKSITAFKGFIAAVHKNSKEEITRLILDARILGGSSGGPVINLRTSKVIGVATEILIDSESEVEELPQGEKQTHSIEWGALGGAIPVTQLHNFLKNAPYVNDPVARESR